MTLAAKGSRRIIVDGTPYRWKVRGRPTYSQANGWTPLSFVVEYAERQGAPLVVSLPHAHPGNWLGLPSAVVLPRTVAAAIKQALADGWEPAISGPAFESVMDDTCFIRPS
jgi:hypothetical protein